MKYICIFTISALLFLGCEEQQYPVSPVASPEISDGIFSNIFEYEGHIEESYYQGSYILFDEVELGSRDEIHVHFKRCEGLGLWTPVDYYRSETAIRVPDSRHNYLGWNYRIIVRISGDD
ncbi:MAG: hypothetical protein GY839_01420 [candidate division Zixibacteria bacterium]|nr:hypothetical protein [candidate division Zixibacteria bacterium]